MLSRIFLLSTIYIALFLYTSTAFSQDALKKYNLEEVIELGLANNKKLRINQLKEKIAEAKERDLKMERLPEVDFHTGFNLLGNIYQYQDGFGHKPTEYEVPRVQYDFTLEASIPIFLGGRLVKEEKKAEVETTVAWLNTRKDERLLKLQIITGFLQLIHLEDQKILIKVKIHEDSINIHHISALRKNNLVTNNEVLRAELQLSNHQMSLTELVNQYDIVQHQIKTLIALPEQGDFEVFTEGVLRENLLVKRDADIYHQAFVSSERLQILKKEIEIGELEKKIVKSSRLPQITFGGEYGLKYPNFMFFPPQPHLYHFGLMGVSVKVPLTKWGTMKHKIAGSQHGIDIAKLEVEEQEEEIVHEVYKANKLLQEAEEKIVIAKQAIQQAEENYRIVKVKYGNQLSLITELIDADNAYLEAQSRLISLEVNRQLKYYQLEYLLGNL